MHTSDGFRFRDSHAAQKEMAELALSFLSLRADTPAGVWVDQRFPAEFEKAWAQARSLAGPEADVDVFLSVLNLADVLLRFLVGATGMDEQVWLARVRTDYVDAISPDGTGVWGPRELTI